MAEGDAPAGTIGGDEPDKRGSVSDAPSAGADAFAAAIALDASKTDPELRRKTAEYLEKHGRLADRHRELVDLQIKHFEDAPDAEKPDRGKRFGEWVKHGFEVVSALGGIVLVVGLLAMLYGAFTSHSVVVNAFKAPAALAGRGITGDVVASRVLDALSDLQVKTRQEGAPLDARSAWASDVKIQVPQFGVSIGEIDRSLHERFGHDVHINGELIQTPSGEIALTIRGDALPAQTFTGKATELDALCVRAAEYLYGRSQPIRYGTYLVERRPADGLRFAMQAYHAATNDSDRAQLALLEGVASDNLQQWTDGEEAYERAMALDPKNAWIARANLLNATSHADEEAGWQAAQRFATDATAQFHDEIPVQILTSYADVSLNYQELLVGELGDASAFNGAGTEVSDIRPVIARTYMLMHDEQQAKNYLAQSDPDDPNTIAARFQIQALSALRSGHPADAVRAFQRYETAWRAAHFGDSSAGNDDLCPLGYAYFAAGRYADAIGFFARMEHRSQCDATRAYVLASRDVAAARKVWTESILREPDLVYPYLYRGYWEAGHNQLKAAERDFRYATGRAPGYAEPYYALGGLLAAEKRWREALAQYDLGLADAPAWSDLKTSRDVVAKQLK